MRIRFSITLDIDRARPDDEPERRESDIAGTQVERLNEWDEGGDLSTRRRVGFQP